MPQQTKLAIKKAIFEAKFDPSLCFFDLKNQIGECLLTEFPDWQNSEAKLAMISRKHHCNFQIECNRFCLDADVPKDVSFVEQRINLGAKKYSERLPVSSYKRLGTRLRFLVGVEMRFEELVDIIQTKLLVADEDLSRLFASKYSDLGYIINYQNSGYLYNFQAAPAPKSQIPGLIGLTQSNINKEDMKTIYAELPEVGVVMDIDCYKTQVAAPDFTQFVEESLANCEKTARGYKTWLFEEA